MIFLGFSALGSVEMTSCFLLLALFRRCHSPFLTCCSKSMISLIYYALTDFVIDELDFVRRCLDLPGSTTFRLLRLSLESATLFLLKTILVLPPSPTLSALMARFTGFRSSLREEKLAYVGFWATLSTFSDARFCCCPRLEWKFWSKRSFRCLSSLLDPRVAICPASVFLGSSRATGG